jgi:hypothetical protein
VDLSVLFDDERHSTISPRRASLCGFKRLERLQLPFETVSCNFIPTASDSPESLIKDLIPASVIHLSFDAKALEVIFHYFPAVKAQAPALKEIHLTLPVKATRLYRDHFTNVSAEFEKADVVFREEQ